MYNLPYIQVDSGRMRSSVIKKKYYTLRQIVETVRRQ